jgi:hypothetical protein
VWEKAGASVAVSGSELRISGAAMQVYDSAGRLVSGDRLVSEATIGARGGVIRSAH